MKYDVIIVGGGIAGLRMGLHLLHSYPDMRCCILEKTDYIGGRIYTYKNTVKSVGHIQWESGAGRISTDHHKTLGLLKEYGLTFIPIPSNMDFMTGPHDRHPNPFEKWIEIYLKPLMVLPQDTLRTHTLEQLLEQVIGKEKTHTFFDMFPYYAETRIMRADVALHSFTHEMASNEGFGVCKEGFASVTHHMTQDFVRLGGSIKKGVEIQNIQGKPYPPQSNHGKPDTPSYVRLPAKQPKRSKE
jgi:phytoene dehydrogenase-like protein